MNQNEALSREEIISVIEGTSTARRVPFNIHFWVHPDTFGEKAEAVREILSKFPEDIQVQTLAIPAVFDAPPDHPDYRWVNWDDPYKDTSVGLDERIALPSWDRLGEVLDNFPDPAYPDLFALFDEPRDSRYRLGHWWFCLFERHWSLRGMTDALMDYYIEPDKVHLLFRAITDFYLRIVERAAKEQQCDGIWFSDDLGTQAGPFFSPEIFREFFKPYYREMFAKCHELGMHAWMHTCGNIEPFLNDWIEAGLDVVHPIQKHTMNETEIAKTYSRHITIFSGIDVQQVIPWGTPAEVKQEVRFLLDTFWRNGKCMLTAGNGINQDCPLDSLEAFFEEALEYGRLCAERSRHSGSDGST
jgi:uroporphyrinogen decarboxylase